MRNLMRAGYLCALMALASCAGDSSSTSSSSSSTSSSSSSSSKQSAGSSVQPGQALKLTTNGTGLVQRVTPKGVLLQLDEHHQHAIVARRNADGSLTTECHDEQHEAEAFLQGAAVTTSGVK